MRGEGAEYWTAPLVKGSPSTPLAGSVETGKMEKGGAAVHEALASGTAAGTTG
jgi:hypothetical protein